MPIREPLEADYNIYFLKRLFCNILEADRNVSGLVVERYELSPRWRQDTDNSPQIHLKR